IWGCWSAVTQLYDPDTNTFSATGPIKGWTNINTATLLTSGEVLIVGSNDAGIGTISCHTFRATGITAYLQNGGRLEVAQQMANHESARTTGLYDRRGDEISLDEVERIT